jgi:predicted PurR-regulated permease PerM
MADKSELRISGPVLLSCAAFVVIVAGLRAAQPIVVPLVVATFIAMICMPALKWLQDKGLPTWLAFLAISTVVVLFGLLIVGVVGTSVNQMRQQLPEYQERVADLQHDLIAWLKAKNIDVSAQLEQETFNARRAVSLFGEMLSALGSVLSDALVIVFTLIFMIFEAAEMPAKLRAISGGDNSLSMRIENIQSSLRRYITMKTQLSALTSILVTFWLLWLGVDFALLWGLLAFLFNYIPNIGSIIAAIPAVVLALLQLGVPTAAYAAVGYLAINGIIGNAIEPRIMGRGLGLSPLVVFVSLIFWGWVLGPIGLLFSVPLTMIVKIVLDHSEDMQWLGILLGAEAPRRKA